MEYTIKKLGELARISTRTLRYYDEIGLLKPARVNSSGYRIYGEKEVDKLQLILFYKELDIELDKIKEIIENDKFDVIEELRKHREKLLTKKNQIELLINNINNSIDKKEGRIKMSDKEKFEGFKKNMVEENERKYGKEIREKYGDDVVNKSNQKMLNMTEEQCKEFEDLTNEISETLEEGLKTKNPEGELGEKVANLHKKWLVYTWKEYSKEAHIGLANMYVQDERFKAYYDKVGEGAAQFLRDAIIKHIK